MIKRCPCGEVPIDLAVNEGSTRTYAFASCNVCAEWAVEFRTVRHDPHSKESYEVAVQAWNAAPRGDCDD